MTNKKRTRRALFNSAVSLILCFAMLLGTTFAWFTDKVETGMNTINAGNLDVELLADGEKVDSTTKLFDDVTLWEPGVVTYENLQVANVGTLALKYQMTLNFGNENNLNGHKLSEILKVAVLDETIDENLTRVQVLEKAKEAIAKDQGKGALSNFYEIGELEANTEGDAFAVVIFWEPNANEIDNLYNANNGQVTSDGEPLHIDFGVNLQATQLMSESDSFGNDYDEFSSILPKATVNNTGAQTVPVYMGYDADKIELDASFQFLPNEQIDEETGELISEYKDWHVDFVVKADHTVSADSMALAGYYEAWCQENGWVVLTGPEVEAGDEIRLVASMNNITVSYEEICEYGNDDIGFMCGLADVSDEKINAGTTITVELRMYEVDETLGALSSLDSETGKYEVIGTYSYTFGANKVSTANELATLLTSNRENITVALTDDIDLPITSLGKQTSGSGEYKLGGENTKNITIDLNGHKLNITTSYWSAIGANNDGATITIKNGSMTSTGNSAGTWNAYDVRFCNCNYVIENVTFDKAIALDNAGKKATLKNVTINETHDYYAMWITAEGQTVDIDGLTINSAGRGIKIDEQYVSEGNVSAVTLNVSNATFDTASKAAIMVKSAAGAYITLFDNVDISNVAVDSTNAVWVDSDASAYAQLVDVKGGSVITES